MPFASGRPKILFVVTEDWVFTLHRLNVAQAAKAAGIAVAVAGSPGKAVGGIRSAGFEFFPLHLRRGSYNPIFELSSICEIVSLYRRVRPDLVHHVALKSVVYGTIAAKIARLAGVVNAVSGLGYAFSGETRRQRLSQGFLKLALRTLIRGKNVLVTFENPDDERLFLQDRLCKKNQSRLIQSVGVDTERFSESPEPAGIPVVLLPSRLIWDKGVGELVDAARILKSRGVDFRVVLAGSPDLTNPNCIPESQLEQWVREGAVEWLGPVEDMPALYSRSHVVCLPSKYREGIPMSLIEAASCARPIVTTDSPGCREIARHNVNGLLVPPGQSGELADALQLLLTNPPLRNRMGREGRRIVLQNFSKEIVVGKTFEVYKQLLGEKWPGR